jgi:predicted acyl esterase
VSDPLPAQATYVGLGYVDVPYVFTGQTGQLDARVWDVAPSGQTLLVSRGAYRVDVPGFDAAAGTLRLPLFGNHWMLQPGHRVRLDLTQADQPFLRPSNPPSSLTFTNPRLVLPTREAQDATLAGQ